AIATAPSSITPASSRSAPCFARPSVERQVTSWPRLWTRSSPEDIIGLCPLDLFVVFRRREQRGRAIPQKQIVFEDAGLYRRVSIDEFFCVLDRRYVEDKKAAIRECILFEWSSDRELTFICKAADVRHVSGKSGVAIFPLDLCIVRPGLQDAKNIRLHPVLVGTEPFCEFRVVAVRRRGSLR